MHTRIIKVKLVFILFICLSQFLYLGVFKVKNVEAEEGQYPNKPIEIICGQDPGSFVDVSARIIGEKVSKILGVPVIIVNQSGAHGKIALRTAAKAKPDGYTLLTSNQSALVIDRIMTTDYPIDPEKDLKPIYQYGAMPSYGTVNAAAPWKTLQEFLDDAKKNPNKFNVGTAGVGSTSHFILEILSNQTGAKINHVPFKAGTSLVTQIMGGHLSAVFTGNPTLLNNIKAGNLKALAIFAGERNPEFPNIPTVAEAGYPDANLSVWGAFFAPPKLPDNVSNKLVSAFEAALKDREVISALTKIGILFKPIGPAEITKQIKIQYPFLLEFSKKANIKK